MTVFEYHAAGNTEAQQKQAAAYIFAQSAIGKANTGVLDGLGVSQTATASGSVLVAAGAGVVQASTLNGASLMVNDTQVTLDVLTANPMGGTPRNDVVVLDQATDSVRVIVGTPSSTPTDPTVPASAIKLARLSHAASATTVPTASITDLRASTTLAAAETNTGATEASWTPTMTGVSSPTSQGRYQQIGSWVHYRLEIKLTGAVSGNVTFTLPITPAAALSGTDPAMGLVHVKDVLPGIYLQGIAVWDGGSSRCRVMLPASSTNNNLTDMSASTPITWASGDFITVSGTYRV